MAPFSSSEAKQHINQDIKKMSKHLGKASQQVIKIMMNGVKSGKYDAMDLVRGIKSGNVRATISESINIMGTSSTTSDMDEDNILISSLGTGSGNAIRVNAGAASDTGAGTSISTTFDSTP